jgi:hypothetical protein
MIGERALFIGLSRLFSSFGNAQYVQMATGGDGPIQLKRKIPRLCRRILTQYNKSVELKGKSGNVR